MSIFTNMPADGRAPGWVVIGDPGNGANPSLTWDTVRAFPGTQPQAAGNIQARCFKFGFDTYIVTEHSEYKKGYGMEFSKLYWLPWGDGQVARVTWGGLAGAHLFLTSTFTGCRFVVNATGVAHVAWGTHVGANPNGSVGGRDQAEMNAGSGNPNGGGLRRTLSISGPVAGRLNENRITYDVMNESCVVMGWKDTNTNIWTFKCLKMQKNSTMKSEWITIATVDVSNLANIVIN
jgi:hypothetical protein